MAITNIVKLSKIEREFRIEAEYYQKKYYSIVNKLLKLKNEKIEKLAFVSSGSTPSDREEDLQDGILLLKTINIEDGYLNVNETNSFFIGEETNKKIKSSELKGNEVLINIVGATVNVIGRAGLFPEGFVRTNITQAMSSIRINPGEDIYPEFLTVFLNSYFGKNQVLRLARQTGQFNLNHPETNSIIIPILDENFQKGIKKHYKEFWKLFNESKQEYLKAEKLLIDSLMVDQEKYPHKLDFIRKFSSTDSSSRLDAEYHQPKFDNLFKDLEKNKCHKLGDLYNYKKGREVGSEEYLVEAGGVLFFRVSDYSKFGFQRSSSEFVSEELYEKLKNKFQPKIGEILFSKDASAGITYVLKENIKMINSGGILRLIKKGNKLNNEITSLILNSIIGKFQIEKECGGSVIRHLRPEKAMEIIIPDIPKNEKEILDCLNSSFVKRIKSFKILSILIKAVEISINKNVSLAEKNINEEIGKL